MVWSDDPELVATFRAEVDERLASLRDGLLALEGESAPRQLVASLFRDAHTVKGSARMLGLDPVVALAHRAEDLLGQLRDGRVAPRRDLVDLLLVTTEGIGRALPGADRPLPVEALDAVLAALDAALAGADPVLVPRLSSADPAGSAAPVARPASPDAGERAVAPPAAPAVVTAPPVHTHVPAPAPAPGTRTGDHVRIPTRRVHDLLDLVGEAELEVRRVERHALETASLVLEHQGLLRQVRDLLVRGEDPGRVSAMLTGALAVGDRVQAGARDLRSRSEDAGHRITRVRDAAMGLAMVPARRVLAAFPVLVRDLASRTGKDVVLVTEGEDVELDVRVLDGVAEALRHLVTNAVDHGCESPEERLAVGKPARATVTVSARQSGSTVVIEVGDDGCGIDEDGLRDAAVRCGLLAPGSDLAGAALHQLVFEPGFTTRTDVTETSGRGVGLDVVRTAVEGLGGSVELRTGPAGTTFVLTLPVTLGVVHCLLVRCGEERFAVPIPGISETILLGDTLIHDVAGTAMVVRHDEQVPLAGLGELLEVAGATPAREARSAVLTRSGGEPVAWAVDEVVGEREVVVKALGPFLGSVRGTAGATIDDDGTVLLLLDLRELATRRVESGRAALPAPAVQPSADRRPIAAGAASAVGAEPATVLVVEDSLGVRELQRTILEGAGYRVLTAVDGTEGAARLQDDPVDLVLSDVEMPGMDGFTLTRTIRRTRGWENVPVVIMTSRGDDADKRAGLDAGADAYLLKSEFDQHALVDTVRRLVGR
jgi:chemotaxis protein histidine kinase CheA